MATLTEMIFIFQLLGLMALITMKLYNVLSGGAVFSNVIIWLGFIGGIFLYGLGLVTSILGYEQLIFTQIFLFEKLLLMLLAVLHFIEVIFNLTLATTDNVTGKRRNAMEDYRNG